MKKGRTSQDLAMPLFIGAFIGIITGVPTLISSISSSDLPLYILTSSIGSLFTAAVYLFIGIMVKKNKIYGDWNVLMAFLWGCVAIYAVCGVLAFIGNEPFDVIPFTSLSLGAVEIIAAFITAYMCLVMSHGRIKLVSRAVFYTLVITVYAVVAVAIFNLVNVCMSTTDAGDIFSAFGRLMNKTLISLVLIYILVKRDEVKTRVFSNGVKQNEEENKE